MFRQSLRISSRSRVSLQRENFNLRNYDGSDCERNMFSPSFRVSAIFENTFRYFWTKKKNRAYKVSKYTLKRDQVDDCTICYDSLKYQQFFTRAENEVNLPRHLDERPEKYHGAQKESGRSGDIPSRSGLKRERGNLYVESILSARVVRSWRDNAITRRSRVVKKTGKRFVGRKRRGRKKREEKKGE